MRYFKNTFIIIIKSFILLLFYSLGKTFRNNINIEDNIDRSIILILIFILSIIVGQFITSYENKV